MDISETFRANVTKALDGGKKSELIRESKQVGGTVYKIMSGERTNPRLDSAYKMAKGLKFDLWQLLVEDFDPKTPPTLSGTSGALDAEKLVDAITAVENALGGRSVVAEKRARMIAFAYMQALDGADAQASAGILREMIRLAE